MAIGFNDATSWPDDASTRMPSARAAQAREPTASTPPGSIPAASGQAQHSSAQPASVETESPAAERQRSEADQVVEASGDSRAWATGFADKSDYVAPEQPSRRAFAPHPSSSAPSRAERSVDRRELGSSPAAGGVNVSTGKPPLPLGAKILAAAQERGRMHGREYSKAGAPPSPNPLLEGNRSPGQTRLGWLAGHYKCAQFVLDAVYAGGGRAPTHRLSTGTRHYVPAESLPRMKNDFARITDLNDVRPGDLIVRDYAESGDGGGHAEIISRFDPSTRSLVGIGAHTVSGEDGSAVYEKDWSELLQASSLRSDGVLETDGGDRIYFLRPLPRVDQRADPGIQVRRRR